MQVYPIPLSDELRAYDLLNIDPLYAHNMLVK